MRVSCGHMGASKAAAALRSPRGELTAGLVAALLAGESPPVTSEGGLLNLISFRNF